VAAWHGARRTKETAMQTQLLIGGRLVAGEGAVESVLDAASGAEIATVPGAEALEAEAVVRHVMVKL
jgi:hypothetical protein